MRNIAIIVDICVMLLVVLYDVSPVVGSTSTSEPEAELFTTAEPESESEAEVTSEPESETEVTAAPEGEAEWFTAETYSGVLVPPLVFIIATLAGMVWLSFWSQKKVIKKFVRPCSGSSNSSRASSRTRIASTGSEIDKPPIFIGKFVGVNHFTAPVNSARLYLQEDIKIKEEFILFQNNLKALLKISSPVVLSIGFCPLTICIYPMMTQFFWPNNDFGTAPKVNDVVACFLMPAGIVYAVAFGFTFQDVLFKRQSIETNFFKQIDAMNKMLAILQYHQGFKKERQLKIIYILKEYAMSAMSKLMNRKYKKDQTIMNMISMLNHSSDMSRKDRIWRLLDVLREAEADDGLKLCEIDKQMSQQLYEHMSLLYAHIVSTEDARSINIVHWIFLECLGYTSFFGILLLDADSYRLQLTLCMLTVLSISAFSFILADVDSPYHGVFRIDLSVFINYLERLEEVFDNTVMKLSSRERELLKDSFKDL